MTSLFAADVGSQASMVEPTLKTSLEDSRRLKTATGVKGSNTTMTETMTNDRKLAIEFLDDDDEINLMVPASDKRVVKSVTVEDDDVVLVGERSVRSKRFNKRRFTKEAGSRPFPASDIVPTGQELVDLQGQGFSANIAETPKTAKFTFFPRLPAELRLKVWDYAMPGPRVVEIITDLSDDVTTGLRPWTVNCDENAPALFYVCQETRSAILKNYQRLRGNASNGKTIPSLGPNVLHAMPEAYLVPNSPYHIGRFSSGKLGSRWGRIKNDFAPLTGLKQIDFAVTFEITQPTVIGFIDAASLDIPEDPTWTFGGDSKSRVQEFFVELQRTDSTREMPKMRVGKWAMGGDVLYRRNNGMRAVGW